MEEISMPLSALLVGGAMPAPLRSRRLEFTALTGLEVRLIRDHPDLIYLLEREYSSGAAQYDLISAPAATDEFETRGM